MAPRGPGRTTQAQPGQLAMDAVEAVVIGAGHHGLVGGYPLLTMSSSTANMVRVGTPVAPLGVHPHGLPVL